jgi:hypothetical protein
VLHGGGELAAAPGRAFGGRRRPGSLTGWAHMLVMGRRRADWAGKGGRSWATAGLEKKGGGILNEPSSSRFNYNLVQLL